MLKGVLCQQVRHVRQEGLQPTGSVVIEDPILTPGELPCHQFVLRAPERVKGMSYAKPASGGAHTTGTR